EGIGDHLEEGGPEVERVLLRRTQDGDRDEVADQADGAEEEQTRPRHLGRNEETADAFDETVDAEPEQQGRLSPGRQDLGAPEPPGLLTAGRLVDECRREECDADADEVDDVVAGVDEQLETAGDDGADELEDEDRGDAGEHDGQLPPRPRSMRMIMSHDCLLTRSYSHMFMYIWIIAGHTPHDSVTEFPAGPVRRRRRSPMRSPDERCMHRMRAPSGLRSRA